GPETESAAETQPDAPAEEAVAEGPETESAAEVQPDAPAEEAVAEGPETESAAETQPDAPAEEAVAEGPETESAAETQPDAPAEEAVAEGGEAEDGEGEAEAAVEEAPVDPDMKWYVIHTYSGYESKVKAALEERLQASPLQDHFANILVPTEDVVEVRGGRRRVSSRKYYPGYILIQMKMSTDTWYLIKNTPKVTGFLGGTNDPTPLSEEEVQKVLGQMRGEETVKPRVEFEEGQSVRVVEGPFANFSGVVEAVNHERGKVRIMVTIFGRPTPVELEFLQVERT
ncbi:MAG: transcription termination/antitermination protein NusG, partial [Nitrospinota bacterium]